VTLIVASGVYIDFHEPGIRGIQVLSYPFGCNQHFRMLVFSHFDFSFLPLKTNLVGPKAKNPPAICLAVGQKIRART
jgi:hypothetical protein